MTKVGERLPGKVRSQSARARPNQPTVAEPPPPTLHRADRRSRQPTQTRLTAGRPAHPSPYPGSTPPTQSATPAIPNSHPPPPPPATGHDLGPRADFGTILAIHRFQLALRLGGWRKHASKPRSVGLKRGSHRSLHPPPSNFTRPVPCPTCRENARQCSTIGLRQVQPTLRLLAVSLRAAGFNRPRSTPPTAAPSRPYARSISTQGAFLDELPRGHNTKETAKYMGSGRKVCPDWARCANRR